MGHAGESDEALEVSGDELWPIVGNDSRGGGRELLFGSLEDELDLVLWHGGVQFVVDDGSAAAVEHRAQVDECTADIDICDVFQTGSPASAGEDSRAA